MHAGNVLHVPVEFVYKRHIFVEHTSLHRRLNHDLHDVRADRIVVGDKGVVQVVARIRPQFRGASVQVPDGHLLPANNADAIADQAEDNGDHRNFAGGTQRHQGPQAVALVRGDFHVRHAFGADTDIGEDHRQQHQVGEDDCGYPYAGGAAELLYHLDVNHQQGDKADRVADQCRHPRDI